MDPFNMLSNDILSHILGYCERTTETKRVCRRFAAVYSQYHLHRLTERRVVADCVVNLTGGTVEDCRVLLHPTTLAFTQAPSPQLKGRDCHSIYSSLMEQDETHAAWLSEDMTLNLARTGPYFNIVAQCSIAPLIAARGKLLPQLKGNVATRQWCIELGDHTVVLWTKMEHVLFVFDIKLELLACWDSRGKAVGHVSLVGAEEHLAIMHISPTSRRLRILKRDDLKPMLETALSKKLSKAFEGALVLRDANGKRTSRLVAFSTGAFSPPGRMRAEWGPHSVVCLDTFTGEEFWQCKDVAPDANVRVPGTRSSGIALRIVGCGEGVALVNGVVVSSMDGSQLLPAFPAAANVNERDALHFLTNEYDEFAGRILLRRNTENRGDRISSLAEFVPAHSRWEPFQFHINHSTVLYFNHAIVPNLGEPQITLNGIGFVLSRDLLIFGMTHNKKGQCCVRAIRMPVAGDEPLVEGVGRRRTIWTTILPPQLVGKSCMCGTKQWRMQLLLSNEKVCVMLYPTSFNGLCPRLLFLWANTGQPCSGVISLDRLDSTKKCVMQ